MSRPNLRTCVKFLSLISIILFSPCSAVAFIHAGRHGYLHKQRREHVDTHLQRRQDQLPAAVTEAQLQQLQQYFTTFDGWINDSISKLPAGNPITFQLQQEYTAFRGWVDEWFQAALETESSDPDPKSTIAVSIIPLETISPEPLSQPSVSTKPENSRSSADVVAPSAAPVVSAPSRSPDVATAAGDGSSSSILANSKFNAQASNNLAVYWGSGPKTRDVGLLELCKDPNINIINLAFLLSFRGAGGYPQADFGAGCDAYSPDYQCPDMAAAIKVCQKNNKKVLLSIGGADGAGGINLANSDDAKQAANLVWSTFGAGTSKDKKKRPFGDVIIDGFDIDNENKRPQYYTVFLDELRRQMDTATQKTGKKYYLSAAPQCPFPDASIPLAGMQKMDFVWVQFYNNVPCNLGTKGFNIEQWSSELSKDGSTRPRVFIGAPACPVPECSGSGYLDGKGLDPYIKMAKKVKNFGGVMLWDGSRATLNKDSRGKDYLTTVKGLLHGR